MRRLLLSMIMILFVLSGCATNGERLYQYSTLDALCAGVYDGQLSCRQLLSQGDIGLGTLNHLDGEMIVVDGTAYQVTLDGEVHIIPSDAMIPFAAVTEFSADESFTLEGEYTAEELYSAIDARLKTLNRPCAMRVSGRFSVMQTRSVPAQKQPYMPITEAIAHQQVFEMEQVTGDMVGFRLPEYMAKTNAAGYHMHFLTQGKDAGGHVLDCLTQEVTVSIDFCDSYLVELPGPGAFDEY